MVRMAESTVVMSCNKAIVYSIKTAYFQGNSHKYQPAVICTNNVDEWKIVNAVL